MTLRIRFHPRAAALATALLAALLLSACSALPDKPVRAIQYDFGPSATVAPAPAAQPQLPALVLADFEASNALDGSAILYRLVYADAHQLRPYSQARWAAPPPQLVRQRLRQLLGRERPVLDPGDSDALARTGGRAPRVLRVDLEEFSHQFESPTQSSGLLRLRATLMDNTMAGERFLAQRSFVVSRPAPTADAPGGVRALAAATDAASEEMAQWLREVR